MCPLNHNVDMYTFHVCALHIILCHHIVLWNSHSKATNVVHCEFCALCWAGLITRGNRHPLLVGIWSHSCI